jgi:hypothetical protein
MVPLTPVAARPAEGSEPLWIAQRLRWEARRVRSDAERFKGEETRRQMINIAVQYDVLADNLERKTR